MVTDGLPLDSPVQEADSEEVDETRTDACTSPVRAAEPRTELEVIDHLWLFVIYIEPTHLDRHD